LRGYFNKEEIEETDRLYKDYLEVFKEKEKDRLESIKKGYHSSIYIPKYSFTRYLDDINKLTRREKRYTEISESNLSTSKNYIKYCVKDVQEALNTRFIHRSFVHINEVRVGTNLKPYRDIPIDENIGSSTMTDKVLDILESNTGNSIIKKRLQNKIRKTQRLTGLADIEPIEVLFCGESVQNKLTADVKNVEIPLVLKFDYIEKILQPFNQIIREIKTDGIESCGKGKST